MKRQKNVFSKVFLLSILIISIWSVGYFFANDSKISFEDPVLEQAIKKELMLDADADIIKEDVQAIQKLSLVNYGITSLDGLQYFKNVKSLDISGNKITDISPISAMAGMANFSARDNKIEDLSPLSKLTQLTEIDVRNNRIVSLEPLKELVQVTSLNIRENNIVDLAPLLSLTKLEDLNARYNAIESVDVITKMPVLRKRIYLEGNPVTDWLVLSSIYDDILDKDFIHPSYNLVFSEQGGIYRGQVSVEIGTLGDVEGEIRYTTNGSEPIETSPVYQNPIVVKENTVIRAKFFAANREQSDIVTHSYLFNEDTNLPIVAISTDPANLFDREKGIYVPGVYYNPDAPNPNLTGNYMQSGLEWERPVHVEIFEENKERVLSQQAGIRMHGGASRSVDRKSFRLYARSEYGQNRFRFPFFKEESLDNYNRILLRNSGNDWNNSLIRDAMLQTLLKDFNVETQAYRPTILYVNGEYWGVYNIRERFDSDYFATKYGIRPENIDILSNNAVVDEGSNVDYLNLLDYIEENDTSDAEVFNYIASQMDIDSFIDYQIAQIFVRNTDWPGNNLMFWRERPSGKWKWIVYDLDFGFDLENAAGTVAHDTFAFATALGGPRWPNPEWSTFLLRSMLENEEFRETFVTRFAHYMNTNFDSDVVIRTIDEMSAVIAPNMEEHIARWNAPASYAKWEEELEILRHFARKRPDILQGHFMHHFELNGKAFMTVEHARESVEWSIAGRNASDISEGWTGTYFTDVPIAIAFTEYDDVSIVTSDEEVASVENGHVVLRQPGKATVQYFTSDGKTLLLELAFDVEHVERRLVDAEVGDTIQLESGIVTRWETSEPEAVEVKDNNTAVVLSRSSVGGGTGSILLTGHDASGNVVEVIAVNVTE